MIQGQQVGILARKGFNVATTEITAFVQGQTYQFYCTLLSNTQLTHFSGVNCICFTEHELINLASSPLASSFETGADKLSCWRSQVRIPLPAKVRGLPSGSCSLHRACLVHLTSRVGPKGSLLGISVFPKSCFRVPVREDMAPSAGEDKQNCPKRVAVIGAGVSGLAAAYKLKIHGLNVTVFEAEGRAGGKLRSVTQDGLIWDEGANTMTESEGDVTFLLDSLGLREKQQFPLSQNKRYIARNGTPTLIPSNPIDLIKSNFLSTGSKLQILLEPLLWKNKKLTKVSDEHESVGGFFQRHFGKEVVDYLIDPFVAGTCGGDPDSLSMHHSFPELWNLEKRFGSVIVGAIRSKLSPIKEKKQGPPKTSVNKKRQRGSFSFLGGMQTLTDAICNDLKEDELRLNSRVLELACSCSGDSAIDSWSIFSASPHKRQAEEESFDAVIMTAPLCDVKSMKIAKRGYPFLLNFIPEVDYVPLSVVITTYKRESVKHPLEGFGVLVPSNEQKHGLKTLGTLFSSMMFPDRAPNNVHLYTTFVGGGRNRELAKASRTELKEIVTSDLKQLLGAEGEPTYVNHVYWSKAFPLYGRNYDSVLDAIDKMEKNLPGLFYAGNHKGGLSVGKALSSGCNAADLVISYLEAASADTNNHS